MYSPFIPSNAPPGFTGAGLPYRGINPPKAAPGHVTIPGYVDDYYNNLLQNNPLYQQQLSNLSAEGVQAATQRRAAIQRLLAEFGDIPAGFTDPYGDVDALTRGLAEKNSAAGLSTTAQLARARDVQARSIKNDLAARGILSSGETGYQLGQNQQQYLQSLTDAERSLLDSITGASTDFATSEADRANQKAQAAEDAMNQILATNPIPPSDHAKLIGGTVGAKGNGYYALGNQLYDRTGNAIDMNAALEHMRARLAALRQAGVRAGDRHDTLAYRRLQILKRFLDSSGDTGV